MWSSFHFMTYHLTLLSLWPSGIKFWTQLSKRIILQFHYKKLTTLKNHSLSFRRDLPPTQLRKIKKKNKKLRYLTILLLILHPKVRNMQRQKGFKSQRKKVLLRFPLFTPRKLPAKKFSDLKRLIRVWVNQKSWK